MRMCLVLVAVCYILGGKHVGISYCFSCSASELLLLADVSKYFVHRWQQSVDSCVMSSIAYVCPIVSDYSMMLVLISLTVLWGL